MIGFHCQSLQTNCERAQKQTSFFGFERRWPLVVRVQQYIVEAVPILFGRCNTNTFWMVQCQYSLDGAIPILFGWCNTDAVWTVQYQCSIPKKTIYFFSKRSILSWCLPIHYKCGSNALLNNLIQCNHGQQYFDFDVKLMYCFNNLHKTDSHRHNEGSSVCLTSFSVWKRLNSCERGARKLFF